MKNKTDLLLEKMEAIIEKVDFDQMHIAMLMNDWATDIYIRKGTK